MLLTHTPTETAADHQCVITESVGVKANNNVWFTDQCTSVGRHVMDQILFSAAFLVSFNGYHDSWMGESIDLTSLDCQDC